MTKSIIDFKSHFILLFCDTASITQIDPGLAISLPLPPNPGSASLHHTWFKSPFSKCFYILSSYIKSKPCVVAHVCI